MTRDELAALLDARRVELHALAGLLSCGIAERDGEPVVELLVAEEADPDALAAAAGELLPGAPLAVSRCGPVDAGS